MESKGKLDDDATALLKSPGTEAVTSQVDADAKQTADETSSALTDLSRLHRGLIVCCVCLAVFSVSFNLGTLGPFFFKAALAKNPGAGAGYHTAIGAVFSFSHLAGLFIGPLIVHDLPNIGSKQVLVLATGTMGSASLLFSALNSISDWKVFLAYSYVIRFIVGAALLGTTIPAMTYLTQMYPGSLGFVNSCMTTSLSLGHAFGTLLSGALYDIGGFMLPFIVTGIVGLLASLSVALVVLDIDKLALEQRSGVAEKQVRTLALLRYPWTWFLLVLTAFVTLAYCAVEALLGQRMRSEFGVSPAIIGTALALLFTLSVVLAPLVGKVLDRGWNTYVILAVAQSLMALGCILVGPAPGLRLPSSLTLVFISMLPLGIGRVMAIVGCPVALAQFLQEAGVGTVGETRVALIGLYRTCLAAGFVAGPLIMSPLVSVLNFPAAFGLLGLVYLALALLIVTLKWSGTLASKVKLLFGARASVDREQ
ncbi:uncharacterized MFS-type transporter YvmA-like [Sycon ciliatum]|uniref:uncharacterized MFS-type transporter YvmA-like n=1 Tax=Sycon ciliatum TaxID=27933 RepID=UPI0031F64814